jgi:hypothetical protein
MEKKRKNAEVRYTAGIRNGGRLLQNGTEHENPIGVQAEIDRLRDPHRRTAFPVVAHAVFYIRKFSQELGRAWWEWSWSFHSPNLLRDLPGQRGERLRGMCFVRARIVPEVHATDAANRAGSKLP